MKPHTLLIVDDESAHLASLRDALGSDYNLLFARHGNDALAAARKHLPALLLLDVHMPDMDGFEVCRRLRAEPSTTGLPVVFVSAQANGNDEATAFELGGLDYLVRPLVPAVLLARLRSHLSRVPVQMLENSYREALLMLSHAGRFNDSDTGNHIWRMAAYARALAEAIGWDSAQCQMLELAAPLHDTGKLGLPQSVLLKPGSLTPEERAVMKTHTTIGGNILRRSEAPVFKMAAEIALCHHERWDGSGYPKGLAGDAIPESARIVALADVFDALSMKRPHKEPWPMEKIVDHITAGAGNHFEPRLTRYFLDSLPRLMEIHSHWDDSRPNPAAPSSFAPPSRLPLLHDSIYSVSGSMPQRARAASSLIRASIQ